MRDGDIEGAVGPVGTGASTGADDRVTPWVNLATAAGRTACR